MDQKRYDIVLRSVGANVRRIRIEKGLTMEQVSNEAEIEYRQLGRIERGEINTTVVSLYRIAKAMDADFSQFLVLQDSDLK